MSVKKIKLTKNYKKKNYKIKFSISFKVFFYSFLVFFFYYVCVSLNVKLFGNRLAQL